MITKVRVDQWEQQMITKMVYQWETQSRMKNQRGIALWTSVILHLGLLRPIKR